MPKRPISVTLSESNLVWVKGLAERSGSRSLSATLDRLITSARESGVASGLAARSIVGTIDISAADPTLDGADDALRDLFARSMTRPMMAKEERAVSGTPRRRG